MPIRLLDPHTAELIAAGEVVERPASVVKELVENAIDAGAKSVSVSIERGGVGLIRVEDDGEGIPMDELPLAFMRHATSKVATKEDLDAIHTLGFRGEALASVASVAQVELLTKNDADENGALYKIAGGAEQSAQEAARGRGTTLTVRELFYNTPARMKFLKKDTSEGTFVGETLTRLALSHPEVALRFVREGKEVFATPGDGALASAVYTVLGGTFAKDLLEARGTQGPYVAEGLVTRPGAARASRSMQFFFINGRFVKNRTMMAALEQAYRGTNMSGKFPGCVLFLAMPPSLVDVNVHPAKTEVRFANEKDVFAAVYGAVKQALQTEGHREMKLGGAGEGPAVSGGDGPPARAAQNAPAGRPRAETSPSRLEATPRPSAQEIRVYNDTVQTLASEASFIPYIKKNEAGLDISAEDAPPALAEGPGPAEAQKSGPLPEGPGEAGAPPAPQPAAPQTSFLREEARALRFIGELFKTYILAEWDDTLCLIDKHAAHERILYEQILENRLPGGAQQLLAPVNVALGAAEKTALLENRQPLYEAGFEIEDFGVGDVLVRAVPADVEPADVGLLVQQVATRMATNPKDTGDEKTAWVLHSIACRAAEKAGDNTPAEALVQIAGDILFGRVPPFCPHGRPVLLKITRKELEKQFGRLG